MAAKAVVYAGAYRLDPSINAIALATQVALPGQSLFLLNAYRPQVQILIAGVVAALPFVVALAILGARRLMRADVRAAPWVLFPVLYALAYAAAGLRGVRMFH